MPIPPVESCSKAPYAIYRSLGKSASQEGYAVEIVLARIYESKSSSEYLSGPSARLVQEINSLYAEVQSRSREVENGLIPSQVAYENALGFAQAVRDNWPKPDLDIDRDGDFRFEWILANKLRLSVAIGPDGEVPYSWIVQEDRGHGVGYLGAGAPSGVEIQIERLINAERKMAR